MRAEFQVLPAFEWENMLYISFIMLLIYINEITNSWGIISRALQRQSWLPEYCCPKGVCSSDCALTVKQIETVEPDKWEQVWESSTAEA